MPLLLFFILNTSWATPSNKTEILEAQKSIKALIRPLIPGTSKHRPKGTENFRVDECERHKIDWLGILLRKSEAKLSYKFKEGCDIEGNIIPKILESFPAQLNLRNLESYNKIACQNKVSSSIESRPVLNLEMRNGELTGPKRNVKFEADYEVRLNPMAKDPVDKNLGGEIRITEINGQKVSIKEKILVE